MCQPSDAALDLIACAAPPLLVDVFPCIPWEIFFFLPGGIAYLARRAITGGAAVKKGTIAHLVCFVTLFGAIYGQ